MSHSTIRPRPFVPALLCMVGLVLAAPRGHTQEVLGEAAIAKLDTALAEAKGASSDARKRLGVRRVIRDAEELIQSHADKPERFLVLEFLFRAQQQLIAMDDDPQHRAALMETCRELIKAPDEYAHLKFQADLLLTQAELAKKGASAEQRAAALRPIVDRYLGTREGAKVLRVAMVMALELGDVKLVADLRELIAVHFPADHEMINFQRDKLGGQVLGAPFVGTLERSDGRTMSFPMDLFGRSAMIVFWSKEGDGLAYAKGMAEASLKMKDELEGRFEILSFNLDELPDAGESLIRAMGVEWPCLKLPGGRQHPIYKAYARTDPLNVSTSGTGQAALVMEGVSRIKLKEDGTTDFERMIGSAITREWTRSSYLNQLCSLAAGDFLVFDPEQAAIDPALPPEWKALGDKASPLPLSPEGVPAQTLQAIQDCFVAPPERYLLPSSEIRAHYRKAVELCRKAIADHPSAPDLWIVRNRLIIALLGQWKSESDLGALDQAIEQAKAALAAGYPKGCEVIARSCLAREALRQPDADQAAVLDGLIAELGGDQAPGPAYSVAAMLALEVADRVRFEKYRQIILKQHTEHPMMWIFSAFLLDRHHEYWLFQVPFTAGWSYGRRQSYFQSRGDAEEARRMLRAELRAADGTPFRIPEDLTANYTAIIFGPPLPWSSQRDDGLPPSPLRAVSPFASFAASRPEGDTMAVFVTMGGKPYEGKLTDRNRKEVDCAMFTLPDGDANPLVHRLGMLSPKRDVNSVLLDREGRILSVISGISNRSGKSGETLINVVAHEDMLKVVGMLEKGEAEAAKKFILALVPPFDPEAVDERGRKLRPPVHELSHLRARARVYQAVGELDKALADAEEVCARQLDTDGSMSLKTDQLVADEAFRDEMKSKLGQ